MTRYTRKMAISASAFTVAMSEAVSTSAPNAGLHPQFAALLPDLLSQRTSSCLSISTSPLSLEFKPPCLSSCSSSSRFFRHIEGGGGHSGLSVILPKLCDNWNSLPCGNVLVSVV